MMVCSTTNVGTGKIEAAPERDFEAAVGKMRGMFYFTQEGVAVASWRLGLQARNKRLHT